MPNVKLIAPAGFVGSISGRSGVTYPVAADRTVTVDSFDAIAFLGLGFCLYCVGILRACIMSPLPADLVSVVAAVTPSNVALTLAAQPAHARKLQVRVVIGTTTTTQITAGALTLVGKNQDGDDITEVIALARAATATVKTANAFASVTSATVAGYTADGSGTGNTVGIGLSNDFGLPSFAGGGAVNFALLKATKITKVLGTSNTAADDAAASATVDAVARTVAPTTAPAANGLVDYEFTYSFGAAS